MPCNYQFLGYKHVFCDFCLFLYHSTEFFPTCHKNIIKPYVRMYSTVYRDIQSRIFTASARLKSVFQNSQQKSKFMPKSFTNIVMACLLRIRYLAEHHVRVNKNTTDQTKDEAKKIRIIIVWRIHSVQQQNDGGKNSSVCIQTERYSSRQKKQAWMHAYKNDISKQKKRQA